MRDVVLDTNILSDFIAIYFEESISSDGVFVPRYKMTKELSVIINKIIHDYSYNGISKLGMIVASSFAFIELSKKFDIISDGRFTVDQFKAFIDSPPEWFSIDDVNKELFEFLYVLPSFVLDGTVEWADAIHCATALARGEDCYLATRDTTLFQIELFKERLIKL